MTKAHLATLTESIDLDWILYVRPFGQLAFRWPNEKKEEEEEEEERIGAAALPNKRSKKKRSIHF